MRSQVRGASDFFGAFGPARDSGISLWPMPPRSRCSCSTDVVMMVSPSIARGTAGRGTFPARRSSGSLLGGSHVPVLLAVLGLALTPQAVLVDGLERFVALTQGRAGRGQDV